MVTISMIVAMDRNRVIGKAGGLPWKLSGDMKFFRKTTMGKPVLMGRKTFESIGKPLEGRANLVLTRDLNFDVEGVEHVEDTKVALKAGRMVAQITGTDEVMIIGGTQIYEALLPETDRIYLTEVDLDIEGGDAHFPQLGPEWKETERSGLQTDAKSGVTYTWVTLERE
jgi:dihydrofolate reductase